MSDCIFRIEYSSTHDVAPYYFAGGLTGVIYLEGIFTSLEPDRYEEGVEDSAGIFYPTFRRVVLKEVFRTQHVPAYMVEQLHRLVMFETVTMKLPTGEVMPMKRISVEHEWVNDDRMSAVVTMKFDKNRIITNPIISTSLKFEYEEVRYGALYNAFDIVNIVAPAMTTAGWSIPSEGQYNTLLNYLGSVDWQTMRLLKQRGTEYWFADVGTNIVNFFLRGNAWRNGSDTGAFGLLKTYSWNWTSSGDIAQSLALIAYFGTGQTPIATYDKTYGGGVRLRRAVTASDPEMDGAPCAPYIGNDGKYYRTVRIGTQVFTQDNLKETKDKNGDDIPIITGNASWLAATSLSMCYFDNDITYA